MAALLLRKVGGILTTQLDYVTEAALPAPAPASLVDLLDRLLGAGIVLSGDVTISLAEVDLITIRLRALIASADRVSLR